MHVIVHLIGRLLISVVGSKIENRFLITFSSFGNVNNVFFSLFVWRLD